MAKSEGDWAQRATDAVLANLMDRRGIGDALGEIETDDAETWEELRTTLAALIRSEGEGTVP
jgi:hypothetical protein